MTRALDIIIDAYERCNRLSPGETLAADDAAYGFRRLNILVDELSAKTEALYQDIITSSAQTGDITLGVGAWAGIDPGDDIVSATVDNTLMAPITMAQYNGLYQPTPTGLPMLYANDGLNTIKLYPRPNGQTIRLQTRVGVKTFADQTTNYTLAPGWTSALGAVLAVRIAPAVLGQLPAALVRAEKMAMASVTRIIPAIVNISGYSRGSGSNAWILTGGR